MLTLVLFALFIKLLLFPFGIKQQKNTLKQAKLRPMEMAKSIFGEKYLRVHLQGFPAMAQDKESIIDLFGVK